MPTMNLDQTDSVQGSQKINKPTDIGIYTINIQEGSLNGGFTRDSKDADSMGGVENGSALPLPAPVTMACTKEKSKMCRFLRLRWTYWYNVPIAIIIIVALILSMLDIIPHHRGGFYCNDPAISFKFQGDTISIRNLLLASALAPLVLILFVEFVLYRPEKISLSNPRCKMALKNTTNWYGEYLLAFIFNLLFMDTMKIVVGEPRPHFLDTCEPDAAVNCTPGTYISDYICTSKRYSPYYIEDSNKSFPSGHTSLSIYLAIFLFCYLQARACSLRPRLAGPTLQVVVVLWTIVCSMTRMTDHRHHWWDVLAGACLGVVLAYYSVVILCKHFVCDNPPLSRSVPSNGDSGNSLDNHTSVRRLISTSSMKQDDTDSGITPVT